ncbi:quinoprotein amine dehydrogenase, beta chain-like protein [Tanacetum coccineum]
MPRLSVEKPHFSHFIEWLLFTILKLKFPDSSFDSQNETRDEPSLLEKTYLFSTAGRTTELFEECFHRRWYQAAACYILVIAKLEGVPMSQYCAICLLKATLHESLYELAGELVCAREINLSRV